jgi:hypothetical protein
VVNPLPACAKESSLARSPLEFSHGLDRGRGASLAEDLFQASFAFSLGPCEALYNDRVDNRTAAVTTDFDGQTFNSAGRPIVISREQFDLVDCLGNFLDQPSVNSVHMDIPLHGEPCADE